jgi:hypothetical protein
MAERKSALKRAPERPELNALLEKAKGVTLTDEQLREQRASFVYGNAPKGSRITKESAHKAVNSLRVVVPA